VLVSYLVTMFVLVSLNFLLPRAVPGDPIDGLLASGSPTYVYDEQARAELNAYYGLDRPLGAQYAAYLGQLATGDLGRSITTRAPVSELILDRLPWTLLLMGSAVTLATVIGVVAGVHTGWRRGRLPDRGLLAVFVAIQNLPAFLLAFLVLIAFAVHLDWFPLAGAQTPFGSLDPFSAVLDVLHHLALPAGVLTVGLMTQQFLITRAGMVSELGSDYLVLGRAKGLTERRLKYAYAARNAILPVVSLVAFQLGAAVTGTVLVERVFAYPGLGLLLFDSIRENDYPVLQGCLLVITALVLSANAAARVLHSRLDPRTTA